MSFYFQGNQISYNDIINYFNDMKTSRDNYKKEQIKIKNNEEIKIKEIQEIIKNHKDFFIDLSNKQLCKYGGNSSLKSTFKFNPDLIKIKKDYEITINDDEGIDEIANLLSLVITHKTNYKKNDYDYLNKKINICIIITSITLLGIVIKTRNFY